MNRGQTIAAAHIGRLVFCVVATSFLAVAMVFALTAPAFAQDANQTEPAPSPELAPTQEVSAPEPTFEDGYAAYQRGNFYEARVIWEALAQDGDARALYNLGTLYAQGRGVPQNMVSARAFWEGAADEGHVGAMHNLALSLIADAGGHEENLADAEYEEALNWLQRASEGGFPNSQYTLGKMYQYGLSVEQNDQEAARLFIEAAEQGFASAQYNLGKLYRDGRGVPHDANLSLHYFEQAALQGHAGAQNRLATRFARGEGVERNDITALMWASLSAEQGNERAIENREVLLARMSEDEIAAAQALIDAHHATQ